MIDLYYWTTPNGHKVTIFLEETGTPYKIIPINIGKGEQFKADFLAVSPNNRIPALVDHEPPGGGKPISVMESGAMLVYLGEKTGKFLPPPLQPRERADVMQWLFWQMGGLGPMSGQNNHFSRYAVDKLPYAIDLSRRTRRTIRQNLGFSLAVIVTLVVATLTRGIPLPLGVVGHEGSTVIVVLNGLRLLRTPKS